MSSNFALINKLVAKAGKRDEVIKILIESGKSFKYNAACLLYLVSKDAKDPNIIWVEDLWTSKEEHTAALTNPDLKQYVTKAMMLLEGMPEQTEIIPVED